jgi:hypothetical protein
MVDDEHLNLAKGGRLKQVSEDEGNEALLRFSAHWHDRFWFALMIWMWFVAFIAAQAAIQATPTPTLACDQNLALVSNPTEQCFSQEMSTTHLVGLVVSSIFVFLLPYLLHTRISLIRYTARLEEDQCNLQLGYFYGGLRPGWETLQLLNHLQMCVLINLLSLWLSTNSLGLAQSSLIVTSAYVLLILVKRPYVALLENIIEASQNSLQVTTPALTRSRYTLNPTP